MTHAHNLRLLLDSMTKRALDAEAAHTALFAAVKEYFDAQDAYTNTLLPRQTRKNRDVALDAYRRKHKAWLALYEMINPPKPEDYA